jgi:hypothetical protein
VVRALAVVVALVWFATGCGDDVAVQPTIDGSPPSGFVAMLTDEIVTLDDGMIKWSTIWELCWDRYPAAETYEIETITGEGVVPGVENQDATCLSIEAAAGQNPATEGLKLRDLHLSTTAGQLAYRVRAVLSDDRVSEWSPVFAVGEAAP